MGAHVELSLTDYLAVLFRVRRPNRGSARPGERLVMRHDPGLNPDPYVEATPVAIRKVADVARVRRGPDTLLFDPSTAR